jgi:hypothetical protein
MNINRLAKWAHEAKPWERLLGSTEVIESVFGKLKYLEKDRLKGRFAPFLLTLVGVVSKTTSVKGRSESNGVSADKKCIPVIQRQCRAIGSVKKKRSEKNRAATGKILGLHSP